MRIGVAVVWMAACSGAATEVPESPDQAVGDAAVEAARPAADGTAELPGTAVDGTPPGSSVEDGAATATPTDAIPPGTPEPPRPRAVTWDPPHGPLSPPEAALVGSWVAKVSPPHLVSPALATSQMLQVDAAGKDPVQAIVDAALDPKPVASSCHWMELRADRTGFWSACALIDGQPTALERVDPITGVKGPFGHRLAWTHDSQAMVTRVRFDEPLSGPLPEHGLVPIKHLELRFVQQRGEGIDVEQRFPEYEHTQPEPTVWEVYPGQFVGQ